MLKKNYYEMGECNYTEEDYVVEEEIGPGKKTARVSLILSIVSWCLFIIGIISAILIKYEGNDIDTVYGLFAFIVMFPYISLETSTLGIIFSAIGFKSKSRKKEAIISLVLSITCLIASFVFVIIAQTNVNIYIADNF